MQVFQQLAQAHSPADHSREADATTTNHSGVKALHAHSHRRFHAPAEINADFATWCDFALQIPRQPFFNRDGSYTD